MGKCSGCFSRNDLGGMAYHFHEQWHDHIGQSHVPQRAMPQSWHKVLQEAPLVAVMFEFPVVGLLMSYIQYICRASMLVPLILLVTETQGTSLSTDQSVPSTSSTGLLCFKSIRISPNHPQIEETTVKMVQDGSGSASIRTELTDHFTLPTPLCTLRCHPCQVARNTGISNLVGM